jgi:hypothetical protein
MQVQEECWQEASADMCSNLGDSGAPGPLRILTIVCYDIVHKISAECNLFDLACSMDGRTSSSVPASVQTAPDSAAAALDALHLRGPSHPRDKSISARLGRSGAWFVRFRRCTRTMAQPVSAVAHVPSATYRKGGFGRNILSS